MDALFLDFQKAFDKEPRERLLLNLKAPGIWSQMADWIKSWLSDAKQRVVINGICSGWFECSKCFGWSDVIGIRSKALPHRSKALPVKSPPLNDKADKSPLGQKPLPVRSPPSSVKHV